MGKSLNGKELGKNISQRKDGLYQGRFVNRFGNRQTIYAPTLNELRAKLRTEQYEDEKEINVVSKEVTLDEWYQTWLTTCKKNCRESTLGAYQTHYNRIKADLGWRKLTSLNLIIMQEAINKLCSDNARMNSRKILIDMLNKAIDSDLLIKNYAKQINIVITKEEKKEKKVLAVAETNMFLEQTKDTYYYNLYVLALETGMRIGEIMGLQWNDIDFKKKILSVDRTLVYFSNKGNYVFEFHDTKTKKGKRIIPLTQNAIKALKNQRMVKQKLLFKGIEAEEQFKDLVFVTRTNRPTQQFIVQECMNLAFKHIKENKQEISSFSPHSFRHTFATRAIERGMQPKTLSRILGHATLQMTMDLYCHVTEDTLFSEMAKMEEVYAV